MQTYEDALVERYLREGRGVLEIPSVTVVNWKRPRDVTGRLREVFHARSDASRRTSEPVG